MLARNPLRMDYQQKYEEIVADYNREKGPRHHRGDLPSADRTDGRTGR